MIIDSHVHVGKSIFGYELALEDLLITMEKYEIDKSVICPVQPFSYHLEPENDFIAELAAKNSDSLIGFCRVDPRQGDKAVNEVKRSVLELGLKGLFLHPWEEGYRITTDYVLPVVKEAADLGIPVMIASGFPWLSHALQVGAVAEQLPNANIIMTNGGQINISGLAQPDSYLAMQKYNNLYFETSGVYRQDFIENSIQRYGSGRVLFGSNAPKLNQGFELERAKSATKRNEAARGDLLGNNIAKLLGIAEAVSS